MSKQIQGYVQILELKTLNKKKFLFIYISDEKDVGCLPLLFSFTKYKVINFNLHYNSSMLCRIMISFKVHKAQEQEIKRKMFSLNKKGNTLYTLTECPSKKKKKEKKYYKRNYELNPKYYLALGGFSCWLSYKTGASLA